MFWWFLRTVCCLISHSNGSQFYKPVRCVSEVWNSSKLYRLCCFNPPTHPEDLCRQTCTNHTAVVWVTEMTLKLWIPRHTSQQQCKSLRNAGSFLKGGNFWQHGRNLPIYKWIWCLEPSTKAVRSQPRSWCTAAGLPHQCSRQTLCAPLHPARNHCGLQPWAPCLDDLQLTRPWRTKRAHVTGFVCSPVPLHLRQHAGSEKLMWGLFVLLGPGWCLSLMVQGEGWQMNLLCNSYHNVPTVPIHQESVGMTDLNEWHSSNTYHILLRFSVEACDPTPVRLNKLSRSKLVGDEASSFMCCVGRRPRPRLGRIFSIPRSHSEHAFLPSR